METTGPTGSPIDVRPIDRKDLDRVVLRCWPDPATVGKLFATEGTIGFCAWEGERCVAELYGYRLILPEGRNSLWPRWNNWWRDDSRAHAAVAALEGPAWCHACLHVGRTIESAAAESTPHEQGKGILKGIDTRYHNRGIGTALIRASVAWAQERDYTAVLAVGAPGGLYAQASFSGAMFWTTYEKLRFTVAAILGDPSIPPWWVTEDAPPELATEARNALKQGRTAESLHPRLMVRHLA